MASFIGRAARGLRRVRVPDLPNLRLPKLTRPRVPDVPTVRPRAPPRPPPTRSLPRGTGRALAGAGVGVGAGILAYQSGQAIRTRAEYAGQADLLNSTPLPIDSNGDGIPDGWVIPEDPSQRGLVGDAFDGASDFVQDNGALLLLGALGLALVVGSKKEKKG